MSSREYLGCACDFEGLLALHDRLNARVVDQVNVSQELQMLSALAFESSEYRIKKCIQERISDIASWKWVLQDLVKRLEEVVAALQHEHNSIRVIQERLGKEIDDFSRGASKPGALCPFTDCVEVAIEDEYKFLRRQSKKFEIMFEELDKQTAKVQRAKKRIEDDVTGKEKAITAEERCVNIDLNTVPICGCGRGKKKRAAPIEMWEDRCMMLKRTGLRELENAIISRQQVRAARVQLSIDAQSHGARVDAVLRRRLHGNRAKLDEMRWQREEAVRDLEALDAEQESTEKTIHDNIEQARVVAARIAERRRKPRREVIKDYVDVKLRTELARLRQYACIMRENLNRITDLQNTLAATIARLDTVAEEVRVVITLDEDRIQMRRSGSGNGTCPEPSSGGDEELTQPVNQPDSRGLHTIDEEPEDGDDEGDDYPFDF